MECPICRFRIVTAFFKKDHTLMICKRCRHIYWLESPSELDIQFYYSNLYSESHNQHDLQHSNEQYYKNHLLELMSYFEYNDGLNIIDYGCSIPYLLKVAKELGFKKYIGVDWDKLSMEFGESHGIPVITPDVFDKSVENGSIDIIRFSHVLEHLISPKETIEIAVKKLRPGGIIYITQPSFPIFVYGESHTDLADTIWPAHLHFFSPLSMYRMLGYFDLQIVKMFTHQNEDTNLIKYAAHLDIQYSRESLIEFSDKGDPFFGRNANYPLYCGDNFYVIATLK